ncbi:helix-turn-helix domain-containing protein [Faecalibaculum rodentium]|uniref:helix-turn-helix domain-containing protein n=1 Tax=Faecalibaculum rodentium TaxID=1702221 RepID=UPI0023F0F63B|nr:helix-turn-helix transcriptional regulator [Faecalibaculum rodentium]
MEKRIVHDRTTGIIAEYFSGLSQPFPAHFHKELVIGLMEHGTRVLTIFETETTLKPGTLFLLPPWCAHACFCENSQSTSWRTLRVPCTWQPAQTVLNSPQLNAVFIEIHEQALAGQLSQEALGSFLRLVKAEAGTRMDPVDPSAKTLLDCLQTACGLPVHLQDLPALCGYSPASAQRLLGRTTGLSVHRALECLRIEKARALLLEGASPAQAAVQSGFADQPHFTNVFSLFMGITPRRWISQKGEHS